MEVTAGTVVRDPVCGMIVDPAAGKPSATYQGHAYHFCSEGCRTKFTREPEAYLTATDPVSGVAKSEYQVNQTSPFGAFGAPSLVSALAWVDYNPAAKPVFTAPGDPLQTRKDVPSGTLAPGRISYLW